MKQNALVRDLTQGIQAEHLKATGIGENRPRPGHEAVQPTHALNALVSRAKKQMVRVRKDNAGVQICFEVPRRESFDSALRAHGHEYRRLDRAVGSMELPGECAGVR